MVNSIKDAFERARKNTLVEQDRKVGDEANLVEQVRPVTVAAPVEVESFASLLTPSKRQVQREEAIKRVKVTYGHAISQPTRNARGKSAHAPTAFGAKAVPAPRLARPAPVPTAVPPALPPAFTIKVGRDAACALGTHDEQAAQLISKVEAAGRSMQVPLPR